MLALAEFIALLSVITVFAVFRLSKLMWTLLIAFFLLFFSFYSQIPAPVLAVFWLIFLPVAVIFNIPVLRINVISKPLLSYVQKVLPPMSKTERIALEAGDVCLDGDIFSGDLKWRSLLSRAKPELSAEEHAFIDGPVEDLCAMLNDWEIVKAGDLPEKVWAFLKQKRFLGLVIDKQYGGLQFSAHAHSTIVSKIASRSFSAAVTVMVPNSLGPAELLHYYGTKAQKDHYLPRLANGEEIPCFGLTATHAGSDAASITDNGIVCEQEFAGKKTLGIRLTFDKRYITLAPVATLVGLAFHLRDPDGLLGDKEEIGITLALLPATHKGVQIGPRHDPLGLAFMNGVVRGKDVFIPLDWVIGGKDMLGQGWRMLMECLSVGRAISLPALNTAGAKVCYRTTGAYAQLRQQFRLPIGYFEGVEQSLARIGGFTYIAEATRVMTTSFIDEGYSPAILSAITKYHLAEMCRLGLNDAMDIQAGKAIQMGPKNYLALLYYGVPISITVEGANILTRNLIIFGQGAMRCHPYLQREMAAVALTDKAQALAQFDEVLTEHIGYSVSNFARTVAHGLTGGYFITAPERDFTAYYYQQISRLSAALAFVSDIALLRFGGALKRRESLSARLGDVLSQLYMAIAVLQYYHDCGRQQEDIAHVHYALQHLLFNAQQAFDDFFANFSPIVGRLLRRCVFPYGASYRKPSDQLTHQVARKMLATSTLRERLTRHSYVGESGAMSTIEQALNVFEANKDALKKLADAVKAGQVDRYLAQSDQVKQAQANGLLDDNEAKQLAEFVRLRDEVITVDEF